ncbi:MAG: SDR family oxidoreductase [Candidatus Sumerlaeia bacterium]|nr:SDR family oxidoreductase [Candidatus Sumerlaeia bacterium]
MARLENKVVWITGAGKRLGRAMAVACAREGADIVVHYRSSEGDAREVADEIQSLGRKALLVQGDHGNRREMAGAVARIEREFGRLDALVNNASAYPSVPFEDVDEGAFFDIIRANLYGPFLCSQLALPLLRNADPGRIVNLTDWAVERPYKGYSHYMASKGGLATLTRALAKELAPAVLVNAIAPGPVLEPEELSPEKRERVLQRLPVGRWGSPESIAQALLYLLETDNLCGETINVDGGRSIG